MKTEEEDAHFARTFRPVKPVSNSAQGSVPNWRIAFKVLGKHCKDWPVKDPEDVKHAKGD
tara:strand:+ start:1755 stop:1934 length:180 start_codon:yes stop_codon:yes gene_type:complete